MTAIVLAAADAGAEQADDEAKVTTMKEVTVIGEKEAKSKGGKFLPAAAGAKVYSGKKTTYVDLQKSPPIVNNNLRQLVQQTPGLLLAEEATPLISIGYRGLAPGRAQFTQVLQDGIPVAADMIGYPEAYYTPPIAAIDHVDFIRGGASLMYGPQPGGALNFVMHDPVDAPFYFETTNSGGSHALYENYTAVSGAPREDFGYYSYLYHRQGDGFRDNNSQFDVTYGGSKFVIEPDALTKWTIAFDVYQDSHGDPGGLTRAEFDRDISTTTRLTNDFLLDRYAGHVTFEKELDPSTHVEFKGYGDSYERFSFSQRGGGFGTVPVGAAASSTDIESQNFYTGGIEGRMRKDYEWLGSDEHKLTAGLHYHHTTSPRVDSRGATADADTGFVRKDSDRYVDYASAFAENMFKWGPLSVTPGVRLENIWQSLNEHVNLDKTTTPLLDETVYVFVPLFGLGANYEITPDIDLYGNVSEAYRPMTFTQAVPTGTNQIINNDLEEGKAWQAEVGLRGVPAPWLSWDASLFHMEFEDQVGTVGNMIMNVGDAEHEGFEAAVDFDVIKFADAVNGTQVASQYGSVNFFTNVLILDAVFVDGPNTGFTPQYAPDFTLKGGVEYLLGDRIDVKLAGTFLDDHFADDANTVLRNVPSYKVWDLTAEVKVCEAVSVIGGVYNLFDERYFARVSGNGIEPADGRNFYAGAKVHW